MSMNYEPMTYIKYKNYSLLSYNTSSRGLIVFQHETNTNDMHRKVTR